MSAPARRVRRPVKACLSIFRIRLAEGIQYRMAAVAGAVTSIFWALIEAIVYMVFFRFGNRDAGTGMTMEQAVSYAWIAQFFVMMQSNSVDGEFIEKIDSGDIGVELCRPLSLFWHWLAKNAAMRITPLFIRGGLVLIAGFLMPSPLKLMPPASLSGLYCALLSLLCAFTLCTAFANLLCAVRLNVAWGNGPTYILGLISGVLSGAYLPLQLWPDFMQKFLIFQPFAGYLDIPARLYLGTMGIGDAAFGMLLQLVWAGFFLLLGQWLMKRRLKTVIIQGG